MTLKTAIQALRDDAVLWDGVATTLTTAAGSVDGTRLGESQLSWASKPELLATYEEIRAKAARLLREGSTNLTALSSTLNTVAKAYETSDENARKSLGGAWDAKR